VKQPETGLVEVQLAGRPMLVGRKGDYAAIARVADRDALEKLLAAKSSLANDSSLADWINHNAISAVVTERGIQQLVPKLVAGIAVAQEQIRQVAGENDETAAHSLQLYSDSFQAAR
jgi:predicted regulator of amino acid metabolism with ACT domain